MAPILLHTTYAALVAVAGAVLGLWLGGATQTRLPLLLAGATGTLLAVVVCDILPEAKEVLSWPAFVVSAFTGYGLFAVFNRYVYHICPACAFFEFDPATVKKLGQTAVLLLVALGLHSVLDGVAVVVGDQMATRTTTGVLLAMAVHKLPEGATLGVLLVAAGYTRRTALLWATLVQAATVLGAFLGIVALREASPEALAGLFAHVGGGFLYLIVGTGRTFWSNKAQFPPRSLLATGGTAFVVMAGLLYLMGNHAG